MAQSRHAKLHCTFPLSGAKRTRDRAPALRHLTSVRYYLERVGAMLLARRRFNDEVVAEVVGLALHGLLQLLSAE